MPGLWSWRDPLCGREGLRMLFETLDAEEFGADRRLARPERARRLFIAQAKNGQLLLAFPLRQRRDRALWRKLTGAVGLPSTRTGDGPCTTRGQIRPPTLVTFASAGTINIARAGLIGQAKRNSVVSQFEW